MYKDNNEVCNENKNNKICWRDGGLKPHLVLIDICIQNPYIKRFATYTVLYVFLIIYITNSVFASEIPQFVPKENNQKAGLYKLDDMNYKHSGTYSYIPLNDLGCIIVSVSNNRSKYIEYFDYKTYKFKKLNKLEKYIKLNNYTIVNIIPIAEYRIIAFFENDAVIYDIKNDIIAKKEINILKSNNCSSSFLDPNNNKINIFCNSLNIDSQKQEKQLYLYDYKKDTISNPIKNNTTEYIKQEKIRNDLWNKRLETDLIVLDTPYCFETLDKRISQYKKIYSGKKIIISRTEVDYGKSVQSILPEDSRFASWFAPLYQYDFGNNELTPLNEFVRSYAPTIIPVPNKNRVLILGGYTSIYPNYRDADPKDVPLIKRINGPTIESKKAYIYVYDFKNK